jgi:hypothetical protein
MTSHTLTRCSWTSSTRSTGSTGECSIFKLCIGVLYVSVVAVSVGICTAHYYTLRDETTVILIRLFLVFVLHQQTLINIIGSTE